MTLSIAEAAVGEVEEYWKARERIKLERVREKVIVVLDCWRTKSFSRSQVYQNAPDFIACMLGWFEQWKDERPTDDDQLNTIRYFFDNPTVYMSVEDFELDRFDNQDHFDRNQLEFWKPSIHEEPVR